MTELRPSDNSSYVLKLRIIKALFIASMLLMTGRLFYLQVIEADKFKAMALENRQQSIEIPAYRGEIYVRDGGGWQRIVKNRKGFSLYLIPNNFPKSAKDAEELTARLIQNFGVETNSVAEILRKGRWNPYKAHLLKNDISFLKLIELAENLDIYPGIYYQETPQRAYEDGDTYSHITGYVKEISASELKDKYQLGYHRNSLIGKLGIEKQYDLDLRGNDGYKLQIVDARNRVKEEIEPADGAPVPGSDLYLTIDSRVQKIVYEIMQGVVGGCIVTRPATGEVLALYSYPSYDPNIFIGQLDKKKYLSYTSNEDLPFFNRVIQGEYPPSSTFKIIVSAAALEDDEISFWNDRYFCNGSIKVGPQIFKCEGEHGSLNMLGAFAFSCNTYFYYVGIDISPSKVIKYAGEYFKIGQKTGIDLPFERKGRLPTQRWRETFGVLWSDGDTANLSIGQGFTTTTMVQLNTATCAVANNGIAYRPHLLGRSVSSATGKEIYENKPSVYIKLPIDSDHLQKIQKAMRSVVEWGTASHGARSRVKIAGKTGTAQHVQGTPHAWFTCYAPYGSTDPEELLAVTVFVEEGGSGGGAAAPIAASVIESVFLKTSVIKNYKMKMQKYKGKENEYEDWLKKRGESALPDDAFRSED